MTLWRSFRALVLGTILLSPVFAFAQAKLLPTIVPLNCQGANAATQCGLCDIAQLAQNLLNAGIYIMITLSAIMFAYAGFKALTSGGNTAEYSAAKRIFGNVIVGLIIILVSWLVIDTVMKTFVGTGDGFGPWNQICHTG